MAVTRSAAASPAAKAKAAAAAHPDRAPTETPTFTKADLKVRGPSRPPARRGRPHWSRAFLKPTLVFFAACRPPSRRTALSAAR